MAGGGVAGPLPQVATTLGLDDLDRLFATIEEDSGRLDIVVANAAFGHYNKTFDIGVKGALFTVQKALPLLPDGASVIVISSTNASMGIEWMMTTYSATKAVGRNFVRTWAAELAGRGIRVNAVSPGPIDTPGLRSLSAPDGRPLADFRARSCGREIPSMAR